MATHLDFEGRWNDAEVLNIEALHIRTELLGEKDHLTLFSMASLASIYRNQGRYEDAEKLFVQVMETRKITLGPDHENTLTSMNNLALIYRNQGRREEAEKLLVELHKARKTKLAADHPDTLMTIANLALVYSDQGRWYEAQRLLLQVVKDRKMVLGADHLDTLTSMGNLASTYMGQGCWDEAEKLFLQVLEIRKMKLGPEHSSTLSTMSNLAFTYRNQGRREDAQKLFCRIQYWLLIVWVNGLCRWQANTGGSKVHHGALIAVVLLDINASSRVAPELDKAYRSGDRANLFEKTFKNLNCIPRLAHLTIDLCGSSDTQVEVSFKMLGMLRNVGSVHVHQHGHESLCSEVLPKMLGGSPLETKHRLLKMFTALELYAQPILFCFGLLYQAEHAMEQGNLEQFKALRTQIVRLIDDHMAERAGCLYLYEDGAPTGGDVGEVIAAVASSLSLGHENTWPVKISNSLYDGELAQCFGTDHIGIDLGPIIKPAEDLVQRFKITLDVEWNIQLMALSTCIRRVCTALSEFPRLAHLTVSITSPRASKNLSTLCFEQFSMLRGIGNVQFHTVLGNEDREHLEKLRLKMSGSSPLETKEQLIKMHTVLGVYACPFKCCNDLIGKAYIAAVRGDVEKFKALRPQVLERVDRAMAEQASRLYLHELDDGATTGHETDGVAAAVSSLSLG
ncbi:kinesin light chain 3 [Paramyrothecium foliicola]|nr:kinesin light chain 3 [Paramyrothecium foliicola]